MGLFGLGTGTSPFSSIVASYDDEHLATTVERKHRSYKSYGITASHTSNASFGIAFTTPTCRCAFPDKTHLTDEVHTNSEL